MTRSFLIFFVLLIGSVQYSWSKDFSLQECVDLALQTSPRLKAVKLGVMMSDEDVQIARKKFFPILKLTGNYYLLDRSPRLIVDPNSFGPGIPAERTEVKTQDSSWYLLQLSLEQPIFTGGKLTHAFRKAEALNDEESYNYSGYAKKLVQDTKQAFSEVLSARLKAEALDKTLEAKMERLRVFRELAKEGYVSQEEILQQETDIQAVEAERFRARNSEGLALSKLKSLVQCDEPDFNVRGKVSCSYLTVSLDAAKEAAVGGRDDLKASYARIRAAEEDVAIAMSDFFPRLTLQGNFINQKETNITRSQAWILGAQLEWSIFEWGKTRSEMSRESLKRQKFSYENEELKKEILLEVERLWRSVKDQETSVRLEEKKVRTAEYSLKIVTDRYAEDKVKLSEVLETEARLSTAYSDYLIAINELKTSITRLEKATSAIPGSWEKSEPVYVPEWDRYKGKLQELFRAKKTKLSLIQDELVDIGDSHVPDQPANNAAIGAPNLRGSEATPVPLEKPLNRGETCSPVQVQVGAFKTRKMADAYEKIIARYFEDREIRIVFSRGYHKVRISGFCGDAEAVERLVTAGVSDYLLLKGHNER